MRKNKTGSKRPVGTKSGNKTGTGKGNAAESI